MEMRKRLIYSSFIIIAGIGMINLLAYITLPQMENEIDPFNSYNVTMRPADADSVLQVIGAEGFDSAFRHYSSYRDINDEKFHELRKAYIAAANELIDYISKAADTEVPSHIKGDYL